MTNFKICKICGYENDLYADECQNCNFIEPVEPAKEIEPHFGDLNIKNLINKFECISEIKNIGYLTNVEIIQTISIFEKDNNFLSRSLCEKEDLILNYLIKKRSKYVN